MVAESHISLNPQVVLHHKFCEKLQKKTFKIFDKAPHYTLKTEVLQKNVVQSICAPFYNKRPTQTSFHLKICILDTMNEEPLIRMFWEF